jgi:hypothetical protein
VTDGHLLDHPGEALTDFVVAPYQRVLALEQRVDTNVECTRGMSLSEQTKGSDCSLSLA